MTGATVASPGSDGGTAEERRHGWHDATAGVALSTDNDKRT